MQASYKCGDKMLHIHKTYQTKCQWGIFILLCHEARRFLSCDKSASPHFKESHNEYSDIDFPKYFFLFSENVCKFLENCCLLLS